MIVGYLVALKEKPLKYATKNQRNIQASLLLGSFCNDRKLKALIIVNIRILFLISICFYSNIAITQKNTNSVVLEYFDDKNLAVSKFRNGDTIFHAKTKQQWLNAGKNHIPAWCHYNNDSSLNETYGKLYNWYAVSDERGLAPFGWRIPKEKDFKRFKICLAMKQDTK